MKELHVVLFDGYLHNYGSQIYIAGVFSDRDRAEETRDKIAEMVGNAWIDSVVDGTVYEPHFDDCEWENEHCAGGYVE